jgi:hypothetical protein
MSEESNTRDLGREERRRPGPKGQQPPPRVSVDERIYAAWSRLGPQERAPDKDQWYMRRLRVLEARWDHLRTWLEVAPPCRGCNGLEVLDKMRELETEEPER